MINKVPDVELAYRLNQFRLSMDASHPEWEMAAFFGKINVYYLTGTMQEGMLLIPRNGEAVLWVRRSYERAIIESCFPLIKPMESFRDAAASLQVFPNTMHIETEIVPVAFLKRFQKYFAFKEIKPLDGQISNVRSIKSIYELDCLKQAGERHRVILEERLPTMLHEGMTEVDLAGKLYVAMLEMGHHGVARFGMFDTEMAIGHIAFGESSIYPTSFNGPGGHYGMCPAVPLLGSRSRKLANGDLVFIDIGFGIDGYHTDKTMTYMYGKPLNSEVIRIHNRCVEIQDQLAEELKTGAIPSLLYENVINNLDHGFQKNFMGFGSRQAKFLGHGIGLVVDEMPVIAKGFDAPLQENMVIALEPKKGIEKVGMVGIENTFIVTPTGGKCITGNSKGLILV